MNTTLNADSLYRVQPWVAHRTFRPPHDNARTVLSNDRDHEFLALEGPAASSWHCLAEENLRSARAVAERLELPLDDVVYLFQDLASANLITAECSPIVEHAQKGSGGDRAPTSERYHQGGYTEPSPGGSNLDAEFEFQDWALARGYLWSALWEVTYRCNEACVHCFNPGASHEEGQRAHRKTDELSFKEAVKLLDDMKALGVFRLLLTGGEIALRKDFFELLDECKKRGFSVTIFTNGTLFDDADLDRLASCYPHRVELSLYSPQPEKHDEITRLRGSFEKTRQTAAALQAKGITVAIKMSVMADTINSTAEFRELCESWNIEPQVDYGMSPGVDGARDPLLKLLPEPLELIRTAMIPGGPLFVGEPGKPKKSDWSERRDSPVCGAGRTTMSISPEGHIYPCNSMPIHVGSTRGDGLEKVWRNSVSGGNTVQIESDALSEWQKVIGKDYKVCGSFERCAWCHKCPGMAFLEGGDELGPSTTNCRNAAARMIAFDLIEEGRSPESLYPADLVFLQEKYAENVPLWSPSKSIETRVSLDELKKSLKKRTKATALLKDPVLG